MTEEDRDIDALEAERDDLRRRLRAATDESARLRAQVAELEAARLEHELKLPPPRLGPGVRSLLNLLTPKIGFLYQYDGRPVHVPAHYRKSGLPPNPPCIALVTPSRNQGTFIEETIRSVLDQSYPALEYVVQDGASDDATPEILRRYAPQLHSAESREDKGQAHAVNLGFAKTTGELMAYLNSDDVLLPGTLAYVARFFDRNPGVDVIYGHRVVLNENSEEIGRWILPRHDDDILSVIDLVPQETLFWRRRIWDKAGAGLDESLAYTLDWDLLLRFRAAGARFKRVPRFLAGFRVHTDQKTTTLRGVGDREATAIRERTRSPTDPDDVWRAVVPYLRRHLILHALYRMKLLRY